MARLDKPIGKITVKMVDTSGNAFTENVGYTNINAFDNESAGPVVFNDVIKNFGQGIASLTDNNYSGTTVTYEVPLD